MVDAEYLIDTNIFLEIFLEQNEKRHCLDSDFDKTDIKRILPSQTL